MPILPPVVAPPTPGTSLSALDIIKSALRLIGVLSSGANPTADEANDALMILNQMMDEWSLERLMTYSIQRQEFTLVASQRDYTLGSGGDFDVVRPSELENITLVSYSNAVQPLEIPLEQITEARWQDLQLKTLTGTMPIAVYQDKGFPFRTISFYPTPTVSYLKTAIYWWKALGLFPDLNSKFSFPPGYFKALRYNLAVDLWAEWSDSPAPIDPLVTQQAISTKASIKTRNVTVELLKCDRALTGEIGGKDYRAAEFSIP